MVFDIISHKASDVFFRLSSANSYLGRVEMRGDIVLYTNFFYHAFGMHRFNSGVIRVRHSTQDAGITDFIALLIDCFPGAVFNEVTRG